MKWVGQHIYDLTSRFRNTVYLEDIRSGTIVSGGYLGLDSNNKIVKAVSEGDITGISLTAGTGVDLTSVSGATGGAYAATIGVDVSDFMSNGSNGNIVTATGTDAMTAHTYLTFINDAGETDTSLLSILSNQDIGDKFTIGTTTHGETRIATIDDDATAAHLSFDVDGDIKNIPESGTVYFYKSTNTDDYLKLDIGTHGDAKFTTVDAAAAAAHFEVEADGNITLDAAGDIALEAAGDDITMEAAHITLESTAANDPTVTIQTTANDVNSPRIRFFKRRENSGTLQAGQDDDGAGEILFNSYNDASTPGGKNYAKIEGFIHDATENEESGQLKLQVASHDGGVETGLQLTGGDVDAEVDVIIGNGASSETTIAGNLSVTGNIVGKQYRIVNCNFRADIGTTKYYLPLKSQDEQTVLTREENQEVAVCDGRLVSITYRGEAFNTHSGDATVTFGVETNTVGTSYSSGYSVQETEAITVNNADDQHLWHVVFDSAKHWDSTDMFAISIQSDTDITGSNERIFLTLVIEDDWSTYLAGTTREIDTTP